MRDNKLIQSNPELPDDQKTYSAVRGYIIAAQKQVYSAVNSAMVNKYTKPAERMTVPHMVNSFCNFYPIN